jgi:hypothetical protein
MPTYWASWLILLLLRGIFTIGITAYENSSMVLICTEFIKTCSLRYVVIICRVFYIHVHFC